MSPPVQPWDPQHGAQWAGTHQRQELWGQCGAQHWWLWGHWSCTHCKGGAGIELGGRGVPRPGWGRGGATARMGQGGREGGNRGAGMDGWIDGWIDGMMDRWMDGWVDRWMMEGWMDGWMGGWTVDGWTEG